MKILFVHNFHQKFGGDDMVVQNYLNIFQQRGHEVEFYQRHNDDIESFSLIRKICFFVDTIFSVKTYLEVGRMLKNNRPDVVFVHGIYPLISPSIYFVTKRYKVPVIQMVHDMRFWCPMAWCYRNSQVCTLCSSGNFFPAICYKCYRNSMLLSFLYSTSIWFIRKLGLFNNKIEKFIIPSEHIRFYLDRDGVPPTKIAFHPHIIKIIPKRSLVHRSNRSYIAFLGRLSEEKGVWDFVEIAKNMPECQFKLAGAGPLSDEVSAYISKNKINNVCLVGFLNDSEKYDFLMHALYLVVPSLCWESFGQIVVEAYSVGTPVIAANHGGLAVLVEDMKTGWKFEPGNVPDLLRVVNAALNYDVYNEMSEYVFNLYKFKFSEDVLINDLEETFRGAKNNDR